MARQLFQSDWLVSPSLPPSLPSYLPDGHTEHELALQVLLLAPMIFRQFLSHQEPSLELWLPSLPYLVLRTIL